jgi:hypothetical protein
MNAAGWKNDGLQVATQWVPKNAQTHHSLGKPKSIQTWKLVESLAFNICRNIPSLLKRSCNTHLQQLKTLAEGKTCSNSP